MSLEELYEAFRAWLNPNARNWELKSDAPADAVKAFAKYKRIKNDGKNKIVE